MVPCPQTEQRRETNGDRVRTQYNVRCGVTEALGICLLVVPFLIVIHGCGNERPTAQTTRETGTASSEVWWKQETAATWTDLGNHAHRKWLPFVRKLGTTACDRGVFYPLDGPMRGQAAVVEYYHSQGLRVTSFLTIAEWQPSEQAVSRLIARMHKHLADGCDGVHLDMLFTVADPKRNVVDSDAAVRAVARMRDAVHDYPREPRAMFAGNTWQLDGEFSLQVASLCDVAWIESWGHDDLDLVRIARVARSLDSEGKPTWYHWQPTDNEQTRVSKLVNLPRALYAGCLMEGAVFLCNYQYPVPLVRRGYDGRKVTEWKMFPVNDGWQQSVLGYAQFVKKHAGLLRDAVPTAPVLVAFRAERAWDANRIMRDLLRSGIQFNVKVCGRWPLTALATEDLNGYRAIVTPDTAWARRAGGHPVYGSGKALLRDVGADVRDFCRVRGGTSVVARVYTRDGQILVHLKQYGYTDQADDLPELGPLTVVLHCPHRIRRVQCVSPDREGSQLLAFSQDGNQANLTVPTLTYHNLLIVDLDMSVEMAAMGAQMPCVSPAAANTSEGRDRRDGTWVDLLDAVDVDRDRITGRWAREPDGITVTPDPVPKLLQLALPYHIEGSYDMEVLFTRKSSNQTVGVVLPVGPRLCNLELSRCAGEASGLSFIDGRDARNNSTTRRPGSLENGHMYTVLIQVCFEGDKVGIDVSLDGEPYISWKGKPSSLRSWGRRRGVNVHRARLYAYDADVTYHGVHLRQCTRVETR